MNSPQSEKKSSFFFSQLLNSSLREFAVHFHFPKMELSEETPDGSIRVCGVATFKSGGAVAKLLPELKKVFEVTAEK